MPGTTYIIHHLLQETFASLVLQASLKVRVQGYNNTLGGLISLHRLILILIMHNLQHFW